jgi:glycosyltransferase involved in cell wall biosynthesis
MAGRIAARLAGAPAVVHTCHAWPLHQPHNPVLGVPYRVLETLAARAADATLFQNPDDMRSCIKLKVVPAQKATLIGNGIDAAQLFAGVTANARLRVREEFRIDDESFVLVNVARLELPKGHSFLLQGLRCLVNRANRKVVALCVGVGKDEGKIRAQVEELGLEPVVRFTGYRHDIPDILTAADVSVLTSLFEGVPRALMESMALGLPVVATDVPGTRMLVQSETTGLLVQYGDVEGLTNALARVMDNPGLARSLGQAGKRLVETTFDERSVVDRVLQVYDHVLSGGEKLPQWPFQSEAGLPSTS